MKNLKKIIFNQAFDDKIKGECPEELFCSNIGRLPHQVNAW